MFLFSNIQIYSRSGPNLFHVITVFHYFFQVTMVTAHIIKMMNHVKLLID